jgi:diguanylate cyclase (GGDEF)-like protein
VCVGDDDAVYRRLLANTLTAWGYEVVACRDGEEAWSVLQAEGGPEMAILDGLMPGLEGEQVCQKVRGRFGGKYIYLLLLTSRDKPDDVVRGLEAGADDYLCKPFRPAELRARLMVGKRILALQNELIDSRDAMRRQAMRDPLTGLWNRRAILEILTGELHRSNREHRPLAVLLADLDHFKQINDNHGHLTGDRVLEQAAQRLVTGARPYDMVGRYGGEEFLILIPQCDPPQALRCGERLRERLAHQPILHGAAAIPVTGSFGVAVHPGHGAPDPKVLLQAADRALYRAKGSGRNCVEMHLDLSAVQA